MRKVGIQAKFSIIFFADLFGHAFCHSEVEQKILKLSTDRNFPYKIWPAFGLTLILTI